jgi:hypothetical protein
VAGERNEAIEKYQEGERYWKQKLGKAEREY